MKKFKELNSDQKRVRVILFISIFCGLAALVYFVIQNIQQGIKIDLTLIGASILIGIAVAIGIFFAGIIALMQKEKQIY